MLRTLTGMSTAQIARAFMTSEATMAKRLVQAKRKIGEAVRGADPARRQQCRYEDARGAEHELGAGSVSRWSLDGGA
jgi:DNA-directed RNA polymerase specialized sigma24 family protein